MRRPEHCTEGQRKVIKKFVSEGQTFAYIRDLLGFSNGLITNAKYFSPKAESLGRNKNTSERTI